MLGPVRLELDGRDVPLGTSRQRGVLAALLMTPGRPVPVDVLVDRVWDDRPPRGARNTLATYVARLRRAVAPDTTGTPAATFHFGSGGYRIDCDADLVDLHRARRLAREAREARSRGDPARATELLRAALDGWQPVALAGIAGGWAARVRDGLAVERLALRGLQAECELALGRYDDVVQDLTPLVAESPAAEVLVAPLIGALAASGRPAEALEWFARSRAAIAEELGGEPSPRLQALHLQILRGEAPLGTAARPDGVEVPRQLPGDVAGFTGREAELAALDAVLAQEPSLPVAVVSGTAGVGKTALAVRWGHRVRDRFPDGQLYVDLRGYDLEQPVSPGDALAAFLRALGVAGRDVPADLDERSARYRTLLSGRRLLVVLDNAATVQQVRPLLPGTGSCAVVVTSRDSLPGLVAREGAVRQDLDLLPLEDALALLRRLIGTRAAGDLVATAALARQCARLPLALRVAAELAVSRPAAAPADLVAQLADEQRRLNLLDAGGDVRAAVSAVFSWSVRGLPPAVARTFALLSAHPGPDTDAYAVAALAGTDHAAAETALETLARAHLVHPTGPGRYGVHELLRAYAGRLAAGRGDRDAARERLFGYYVATAATAIGRLYPAESHHRLAVPPSPAPAPPLPDTDGARAWLDAELPCLVAVARASAPTSPEHAVRLSSTLYRFLDGGYYAEALAIHDSARDAARATGDLRGLALASKSLGGVHQHIGPHERAAELFEQALTLFGRAGDELGRARALGNLGVVRHQQARYGEALDRYAEALAAYRAAGDAVGEGRALASLAMVEGQVGRYADAVRDGRLAAELSHAARDEVGEAFALRILADAALGSGSPAEAGDHARRSLALSRRLGDRFGTAWVLVVLGAVDVALGRHRQARAALLESLELFSRLGDPDGHAAALNGLGALARREGRPAEAADHHRAALAVATRGGSSDQRATALAALAELGAVAGST